MMSIVDRLHTLVDAPSPEVALVSGVGQMTAAVASAAANGTNPPAVPPPTSSASATSSTSAAPFTPQGFVPPQPPQPPQPQAQHVQQVLIAGLGPPMAPNTAHVALRNQAGQLHALVAQTAAAVHQATTHGPQPPQTWQAQYYARAADVLASAAQDLMRAATASAQVLSFLSGAQLTKYVQSPGVAAQLAQLRQLANQQHLHLQALHSEMAAVVAQCEANVHVRGVDGQSVVAQTLMQNTTRQQVVFVLT
jgi:hypothetical protein